MTETRAGEPRLGVVSGLCRACCAPLEGAREYRLREMLAGTGEEFRYLQCPVCLSLGAAEALPDIGRYYPDGYYARAVSLRSGPVQWLKHQRAAGARGEKNALGILLARLFGPPPFMRWLEPFGVGPASRVLDVGCGGGELLLQMRDAGFRHLTGVDPFVERDIHYPGGVQVLRRSLEGLGGTFGLIMMHHVLEHAEEPRAMLHAAAGLLDAGGGLLIRTPVIGGHAWRAFERHWIQLDPPRHRCIFSRRGLDAALTSAGLQVVRSEDDSTAFQFWGSILATRGIPVAVPAGMQGPPWKGHLSPAEIRGLEERAAALNRSGDGDQLCVWARPSMIQGLSRKTET